MTDDDKRVRDTVQAELRRRRGVPEKDDEERRRQGASNGSYPRRLGDDGRRPAWEQR